jgi:hypothetical protein
VAPLEIHILLMIPLLKEEELAMGAQVLSFIEMVEPT